MSTTVRDIVYGSLRLIGAMATGETPPSSETSDALSAFNQMIDSWSNESLLIPNRVRDEFTLTANTGTYSIGVGGDIDTARPMKIERALIQINTSTPPSEYLLKIITADEYAEVQIKQITSSIPSYLFEDKSYAGSLENITLYPVPSTAYKLVLYSIKPLSTFTSINDEIVLPPGYLRALKFNLAVEIAPEYGKEVSQSIYSTAMESKAWLKRMNHSPVYLKSDPALVSRRNRYNIYRDDY